MTSKIDELSQSIDKINTGQKPQPADKECAELLEVADLLHSCDIPVRPPEHILSAAVERASEGLAKHGRIRRYAWLYSGVIGAAAALLIFVGIHGFPSVQEVSPIVTPAPQAAPAASRGAAEPGMDSPVPVLPAKESKSLASEPESTVPEPSAPSSIQPSAQPVSPPSPDPGQTSVPSPAPAARQAPAAAGSMKEAMPPPSAAKSLLPDVSVLRLPDRKPDSVVRDPVTGALRQIYDAGTSRELIITQRTKPQSENDTSVNSKQYAMREAGKGGSDAHNSLNRVVVFIQGQEVTLEGRQTVRELTELAKRLKPGTP